jgi:hypothetical protein
VLTGGKSSSSLSSECADLTSACGRLINSAKAAAPAFVFLLAGFFMPE